MTDDTHKPTNRETRRAEALRANLRRRKDQARARSQPRPGEDENAPQPAGNNPPAENA